MCGYHKKAHLSKKKESGALTIQENGSTRLLNKLYTAVNMNVNRQEKVKNVLNSHLTKKLEDVFFMKADARTYRLQLQILMCTLCQVMMI